MKKKKSFEKKIKEIKPTEIIEESKVEEIEATNITEDTNIQEVEPVDISKEFCEEKGIESDTLQVNTVQEDVVQEDTHNTESSKSDTVQVQTPKLSALKVGGVKKKKNALNIVFNIFRALILIVAAGSFTYVSYSLTQSYLGYKNADRAYSEINNMFMQVSEDDENETGQETDKKEDKTDKNSIEFSSTAKTWVWDYDAMLEYNSESKGYIKLNNSRIQYPIVQHADNDYYLNHGSNRIYNGNGAIFIDARIQGGLDARSCIIYGHDMLDGSMFAGLLKYYKTDYCKTHQIYDIYVGNRHYLYYAFASFTTDAKDEDIYKMGFKNDSDYTAWINRCYSKSNFRYDVEKPTANDKTILLSTCVDDHDKRFVVVLVRGEEVVD